MQELEPIEAGSYLYLALEGGGHPPMIPSKFKHRMLPLHWFKRFVDPPKCLELDTLTLPDQDSLFFVRNGMEDEAHSPIYIIRQNGYGRGLFSLVSGVVCHLHFASHHRLTPTVDLRACNTEYEDAQFMKADDLCRTNPWDFYFQSVSDLHGDIDFGKRIILASNLGFPMGYPRKMLISHVQDLRDLAMSRIKPAPDLLPDLQHAESEILDGKHVLGVHIRGQEQKTMPYHPLSPTMDQIYMAIDRAVAECGFDRIFVASEDLDYVDAVLNRYSGMAVTLPHFRTHSPVNAYRIYPRPNHKYLLGKEILIDAFILSSCAGLVSSTSNVTEFARARNNGRYLVDLVIDNGLNATNPYLAKHVWALKNQLPELLGGFSEKAIQPFPALPESSRM